MKKRVICLYRVSSKRQVDRIKQSAYLDEKLDIPMQKHACRDFVAKQPDWEIYRELSEFGVSGFKVSAKNRDVIQDIQKEALEAKFDVLLVFMFDRLGRIDDETPFVLEWFVKHGIEVWSVKEGEQRFENHVDKLTNYIRFWQASGESIKTSMRTKESMSLIVQEGRFRGGVAPYGYRLEKRGRMNKRGHEVYEIEIDEKESEVVRLIFDLYLTKGYGSQRISTYLTKNGMLNRQKENFTNATINGMLGNRSYTGVLKSGKTVTGIFSDLQIITPEIFEEVQKIREQRSNAKQSERRIPLNTTGSSLLSGNVFCGHCGARLIVTTNGKKYVRKDGEVTVTPRTRYVCYNKTRHKQRCNGQTGYTVSKLDGIIDKVTRILFERLDDLPKEAIIDERLGKQIADQNLALLQAREALQEQVEEVKLLEAEVFKALRGESSMNSDLLNRFYEESREKEQRAKEHIHDLEVDMRDREQTKEELFQQFETIHSWADLYESCDIEVKKMVLARLFEEVRVKQDYAIEIDLALDCSQFGISLSKMIDCKGVRISEKSA